MFGIRLIAIALLFFANFGPAHAQNHEKSLEDLAKLPGGTTQAVGHFETEPYEMMDGPECDKGMIVVPENRAAAKSRNIKLYFYRFKARKPAGHSPVFMLPGGPGGFYNDNWVNGLRKQPDGGSNKEAWLYTQDRDVVLVNQRGARLPDRSYWMFGFMFGGVSPDKPFSTDRIAVAMKKSANQAIEFRSKQGMDLAGYDIMNMVEDINDLRKSLGYEKISLRGTSFGSQWSFAYMRKYPEFVDRAVLSGVEPLDYGYDSHEGVWNVFKRIELRLSKANGDNNRLNLPDVGLTEAIQKIVERLGAQPIEVEAQHSQRDTKQTIPIGAGDFQRMLRSGINARRESVESLANFHRYIFEVYNEDYRYLASRTLEERAGMSGGSLQSILIDNSLGISEARDAKLTAEPARQWLGELNTMYKATRDVTPSPEIPDAWRTLESDLPILFVQGDMDLSTPIENALDALKTLPNCHMIRIIGGTHGAFGQIATGDESFLDHVKTFLDAPFDVNRSVKQLGLPESMEVPIPDFKPVGDPTLFDERMKK